MNKVNPSQRVQNIKEYYFSIKLKEVARLKAEGRDIISLGVGGPDLPPHPDVIAALTSSAALPSSHSYQTHNGTPRLRRAFADWYRKYYGVTLDPDKEILPLIGSKEAVTHISLAFLNPGDKVLVPNPGYPTYTSASQLVGAEVLHYDLRPENGWLPDFEALETMDLKGVKLMWINYPHMPTGTPASRALYEKIVDFGRRHSIVIVHDNPYSFILNPEPMSLLSVPGAKDICIELNSLSKSHNMAGWRVAMLASNPEFVGWVQKVKSNVDSGQFLPVMEAAATALSLPQDWYDDLNKVYASRRKIAEEIMAALGCAVSEGQQGLFVWGRIPDKWADSYALADHLLYNHDLFLTPGSIFGTNGDRYIRISLCADEATLCRALSALQNEKLRVKS